MDNELELGFETPVIKQMIYASTLGNSSYAVRFESSPAQY